MHYVAHCHSQLTNFDSDHALITDSKCVGVTVEWTDTAWSSYQVLWNSLLWRHSTQWT